LNGSYVYGQLGSQLWLLVDAAGETILGLNRAVWDGSQLEALREVLGLLLQVDQRPIVPASSRSVSGERRAVAAQPVMATLLVIVTLVVVALAF
jgi:hypothetical protein